MHQLTTEPAILELKPAEEPRPTLTIDQVLESARLRSEQRELELRSERRLPNLSPPEKPLVRWLWIVIALALAGAYFCALKVFWAPSDPGVDQNAYQVGGKLFAEGFTTGFKPVNPYTFVGWMWVQTADGWVYAKYPLGVPVLDAICIWLAPNMKTGIAWSYLVSPACTVLASIAMFLMLRMVASSFAAICGMILLACNPIVLVLANNSNSHAAALAFTAWGMLCLIWWMRYGGWWRGLVAGFLLGFAVTIRYTEGLLVLPIAAAVLGGMRYETRRDIRWWAVCAWLVAGTVVCTCIINEVLVTRWKLVVIACGVPIFITAVAIVRLSRPRTWSAIVGELIRSLLSAFAFCVVMRLGFPWGEWKNPIDCKIVAGIFFFALATLVVLLYTIRWREPRSWLRPSMVVLGWLIPVVILVCFNKAAMGTWTGYDSTNESDGFSFNYFMEKWDYMLWQVYNMGLFFIAPIGIAGMFLLYRASGRLATVMLLWFLPALLLYTGYYWGKNVPGAWYLRFFLTLFPPVIFSAVWFIEQAGRSWLDVRSWRGAIACPVALGVVVAVTGALSLFTARGPMERDWTICFNCADTAEHVIKATKQPFEPNPALRPLLFGPNRPFLNYMQYAGNYECYSDAAFSKQGGEAWRPNPNAPHPLQLARMNAILETYEKKTDSELWAEGRKIIDRALEDHRQVLIALPTYSMPVLRGKFVNSGYMVESRDKWREPVKMSEEAAKAFRALGPIALFIGISTEPKDWEIIEVTKKPSAVAQAPQKPAVRATTKPVVKPTSRPTSKPTTRSATRP